MNTLNQDNQHLIASMCHHLNSHVSALQRLAITDPNTVRRATAWRVMGTAAMGCYVHAQALKSLVPWVADIEAQLEARLRQAWTCAAPFPALPERFTTWYRLGLAIELMALCADELHQLYHGNSRTRWQRHHQAALIDTVTALDAALFHLTNVNRITAGNLRLIAPDGSSRDQDEVSHE